MSENQKAITILTKRMNRYHPSDDITKATKLAISAIEKQIPQKVIYTQKNYSGLPIAQCPTCNNRGIGYGNCFCARCGQRLDWSDEK